MSSTREHGVAGRGIVVGLALLCLLPLAVPGLRAFIMPSTALAAGVAVALLGLNGFGARTGRWARLLMQTSVVLLGLSMDLHEVAKAGMVGVAFAAGTIIGTFSLGIVLGRLLRTGPRLTTLMSAGTAICGGSAIAATGPVIGATAAEIAVATGTVFILNGVGLYLFPPLGHALAMTQEQFGTWAAVAIHDVSSVVGAAGVFDRRFGTDRALEVATAVKLTRALWIVPVALTAAWVFAKWRVDREEGAPGSENRATSESRATSGQPARKVPIPWFIGLFVLAAAARTFVPGAVSVGEQAAGVAKVGMTLALFFIGAGMSVAAVRQVGWRVMVLGMALWVFISGVALLVVRATIVG